MEIRVECYSGHRGQETPRRFILGSRTVDVGEVLDRWLGPDHRYFKVRGDDGAVYILRHDAEDDHWELTLFLRPDQGGSGGPGDVDRGRRSE